MRARAEGGSGEDEAGAVQVVVQLRERGLGGRPVAEHVLRSSRLKIMLLRQPRDGHAARHISQLANQCADASAELDSFILGMSYGREQAFTIVGCAAGGSPIALSFRRRSEASLVTFQN